MKATDVKIGLKFLYYDSEDQTWYLTEVIELTDNGFIVKDIDKKSPCTGMTWFTDLTEFENPKICKSL